MKRTGPWQPGVSRQRACRFHRSKASPLAAATRSRSTSPHLPHRSQDQRTPMPAATNAPRSLVHAGRIEVRLPIEPTSPRCAIRARTKAERAADSQIRAQDIQRGDLHAADPARRARPHATPSASLRRIMQGSAGALQMATGSGRGVRLTFLTSEARASMNGGILRFLGLRLRCYPT